MSAGPAVALRQPVERLVEQPPCLGVAGRRGGQAPAVAEGGPREQVGAVEAAGQLGRLEVAAVAGDELARPVVGVGQVEPELARLLAPVAGRVAEPVVDVDRPGQEPHGALVGGLASGLVGGGATPADRQLGGLGVGRLQVVVGDLGGRAAVVEALAEGSGDAPVQVGGALLGHVVLQGTPTTAWAKARLWPSSRSRTTPARVASSSRWRRSITRHPSTAASTSSENRSPTTEPPPGPRGLGCEAAEPPAHHVVDAVGESAARAQRGDGLAGVEPAQDLLDEERVPGGLLGQPERRIGAVALVEGSAHDLAHELDDRRDVEPGHLDPVDLGAVLERPEGVEGAHALDLAVAQRQHEEHLAVGRVVDEVANRRSDECSAHWRSSRTSSAGRRRAIAPSQWRTASNRRMRSASGSSASGGRTPPIRAAMSGSRRATSSACGSMSRRSSRRGQAVA